MALGRALGRSSCLGIGWELWRRRWESPKKGVHLMIFNLQNMCTNPGLTTYQVMNLAFLYWTNKYPLLQIYSWRKLEGRQRRRLLW
ncbi:unnamed protein product [Brassica oleracea]